MYWELYQALLCYLILSYNIEMFRYFIVNCSHRVTTLIKTVSEVEISIFGIIVTNFIKIVGSIYKLETEQDINLNY